MATRQINKTEWLKFFKQTSEDTRDRILRLEVLDANLGSQSEVEWEPLRGISYDPKEDQLDVITDDLDHRISHPTAVFVVEDKGEIKSIEIVERDDRKQILSFRAAQAA